MKVRAQLNRLRISPSKVRLVADVVRRKTVTDALNQLTVTAKGASEPIAKLISSAVANAQHNFGLDAKNLYIEEITVGEGVTMKRWLPRAHGRATKLLKRTSRVSLVLAEIEEGKGRTEPQQVQKMKDAQKTDGEGRKEEVRKSQNMTKDTFADTVNTKAKGGGGTTKKMFRRKSM